MSLMVLVFYRNLAKAPGSSPDEFTCELNPLTGTRRPKARKSALWASIRATGAGAALVWVPNEDRPLKGGFAAACGGALCAPLTGRSPLGLGSASGLSLARRFAPAA